MKRGLLAAAVLLTATIMLSGQEVRRALPAQSVAADDVARFLAGVPLSPASPLSALRQSPAYAGHVAALARLSQRYDRVYFSKMRAWSAAELAPRIPTNLPVYYFFAGPDAVSALALFPDARVYILGGLESVGSIPAPNTLTPEAVAEGLDNLRRSAEVVLSYGHFITKDMKAELDRTVFRGALPLIYTFIALTGGKIVSTSYFGVARDGTLQAYGNSGSRGVLPGVRIDFRRDGGAGVQTLYYVQANVADDALKSNDGLLKWAANFGVGNVYLKAASYLPHEPYFSRIRSFLLSQGASVLQDDSDSVPVLKRQLYCWFFGTYSGTLNIFAKYFQSDLQTAFAAPGAAAPLPFGTGYKWRLGESNLLLAIKQQAPRPEFVPPRQ
jgi:hypothetical protein